MPERAIKVSRLESYNALPPQRLAGEVEVVAEGPGCRVNSCEATQFRIWSTQVLKEYLTKGFVLDDERSHMGLSS